MNSDNKVLVTSDVAAYLKREILTMLLPWLTKATDRLRMRNLRSDILAIASEIDYIAQQVLFQLISMGKICVYIVTSARIERQCEEIRAKTSELREELDKIPNPDPAVLKRVPPSWKQRVLPLIFAFIIDLNLVQGAYYYLGHATFISWMVAISQAGVLLYLGVTAGEHAREAEGKQKWIVVGLITLLAVSLFLIMSLILTQVMEHQRLLLPGDEIPELPWYTFILFWLVNSAGFTIAAFAAYRSRWSKREHSEFNTAIADDAARTQLQLQIDALIAEEKELRRTHEAREGQVYTEMAWAAEFGDLVDSGKASSIRKYIAETGKEAPVDDSFPLFDRVRCVDVLRNMLFRTVHILVFIACVATMKAQSEHTTILIDRTDEDRELITEADIRELLFSDTRRWERSTARVVEISDITNGDIYESRINKGSSLWDPWIPRIAEFTRFVDEVVSNVATIQAKPRGTPNSVILQVILTELRHAAVIGADHIRFIVVSDLIEHTQHCSLYAPDDRSIFMKTPEAVCKILGLSQEPLQRSDIDVEVIYRPGNAQENEVLISIVTGYQKLLEPMGVSISIHANLQKKTSWN